MNLLPYEYAAFEKPRQIRLINLLPREDGQLRCGIEVVDVDSAPRFTALSYTHGPPVIRKEGDQERYDSIDPVPLVCDGKRLLLKPNLASALSQIDRSGKHGYYWIDAVCINQEDLFERRAQVEMMGDIYWNARKVLVWLGEEDVDSKMVVVLIEHLLPQIIDLVETEIKQSGVLTHSFTNPLIWTLPGMEYIPTEIWDSIADFFERRWFSRAWTFQEVLLANRIEVYCGETKISWKKLEDLLEYMYKLDWHENLSDRYNMLPQNDGSLHENLFLRLMPGNSIRSTMMLRHSFFKRDPSFVTYLEKLTGGDENIDMLLGYFNNLIFQMRFRSATDPRDHFYSLYGIVARICDVAEQKPPNPLTSPDYTKTVVEVYTENTKSILSLSKSLLMLSNVEDRSQRRWTNLPSWVPDMTVMVPEPLVVRGGGDLFNASKGALPQILAGPNPQTLRLVGYRVDTVTDLGEDGSAVGRFGGPFEESAAMLLSMQTTYVNGQDRAEAFWRTMVANMSDDEIYPARDIVGSAFREFLIMDSADFLKAAQRKGNPQYEAAMQKMTSLTALAKSTPKASALIPSLAEVLERKDIHTNTFESKLAQLENHHLLGKDEITRYEQTWQDIRGKEAHALLFSRQFARTMALRRLFGTEGGLLGLGPRSMRPGDHVFVLPGARVPFVLRPVNLGGGCSGECYEMVGEAYVHGIMDGEALERGKLEKMTLDIV